MKKALCAAVCLAALAGNAAAYQVPYANGTFHVITQQWNNNDPEAQAEMLKKLGLFLGTDKGFELERAMTRAEAAAMLCRFLGGEQEASTGTFTHPFTDVPDWASASVGWLYENKLTYGISETRYGAAQPVTAEQFAAFLSRALAGNDDFKGKMLFENEQKTYEINESFSFERQDAVAMSVRALEQDAGADTPTLAQKLVEKGVFTAAQFADAAWDVIAPTYQDAKGTLAGVVFADRSNDGFENTNITSGLDCALPYLYATRPENGKTAYYCLDCKTLQETPLGTLDNSSSALRYFVTLGETDYFWETITQPDQTGKDRLLAVKDGKVAVVLDEAAAEGATYPSEYQHATSIPIRTLQGGYLLTETGLHPESAANQETVWADGTLKVTQEVTAASTTISLTDTATGEILDTYTVPQDVAGDPRKLTEQEPMTLETLLYGEAGLYGLQSAFTDADEVQHRAKLIQYTAEPALSYTVSDRLSSYLYVISHDPGERVSGLSGMGGTKILAVPYSMYDRGGKTTVFVDKSLGIKPIHIEPKQDFTFFDITTEESTGMGSSGYTYRYSEFDHKLTVTDYTHTYAQELPEWVESDPEGYKKPYIEKEQARIDAIQNAAP